MKHLICAVVGLGVVGLAGCKEGTSTAPPTGTSRTGSNSGERKLTVSVRDEQVVTQDTTDEIGVFIDRTNFDGDVTINLTNLPKGVSLVTKELTIPAGKESLTVTVKAAPDATVTDNHKVKVSAKAKDMPEASTEFDMDVKAK